MEWIEWSAECHDPVCGSIEDPCSSGDSGAGTADDGLSPIEGCSEAELVTAYQEKVHAWHGRCSGCHYIGGPYHTHYPDLTPAPFFWFGSDDPRTNAMMTMYNMLGLGMVNVDSPTESTLLTKPLVEGATQHVSGFGDVTGIWHGGGSKISADGSPEDAMVDFVAWIHLYVACRTGESESD